MLPVENLEIKRNWGLENTDTDMMDGFFLEREKDGWKSPLWTKSNSSRTWEQNLLVLR